VARRAWLTTDRVDRYDRFIAPGRDSAGVGRAPHANRTQENTMSNDRPLSLKETEAARIAAEEARKNKKTRTFTDEEKALRKERVAKAKDALSRSNGIKGVQVPAARAALKRYLQELNQPKQPDDQQFEMLLEAPFKAPPKKRENSRF